jgi:hypothetical protein
MKDNMETGDGFANRIARESRNFSKTLVSEVLLPTIAGMFLYTTVMYNPVTMVFGKALHSIENQRRVSECLEFRPEDYCGQLRLDFNELPDLVPERSSYGYEGYLSNKHR